MAAASKVTKAKQNKKATRKVAGSKTAAVKRRLRPPVAEVRPTKKVVHGVTIADDYAWLRAENWQEVLKDPSVLPKDIRKLIDAENKYAAAMLEGTKSLQRKIKKELRGRIKEDDADVPVPDGPYAYFERYREGGEHSIFCRMPRDGGRKEILLDGDKLSKGKKFFDLGDMSYSPDHKLLAWSADEKGSEFFTLRVRDIATGKDLSDRIDDCDGDAVWRQDSKAFFYIVFDENHRPYRIYQHDLGTKKEDDKLVFEDSDPRYFLNLSETQSGRYATIDLGDHDSSEVWMLDLVKPDAKPTLIEKRRQSIQYEVADWGDKLYILTNADGADDFKIMEAPIASPQRKNWKEVVPHKTGRLIQEIGVFKRHLIRAELEDGLPRIVIREIKSGKEHSIAFEEAAYDLQIDSVAEFDTDVIRFAYSSLTTPWSVYDYNMVTRERVLRKRQKIPSGHRPSKYKSERVFATSHDGVKIPISLLYAKTTKLDGTAPLVLQAYGAYGMAYDASFSANRYSLIDRGFVFAIAHVRGGTDCGWGWYKAGKLAKKTNTFKDFVAAGRHLAEHNYTSVGQIVGVGRSAGGLLIGAAANMAPELFAGLVAGVPFVDALNTMLDDTLPLTPPEWLEWGNPAKSKKAFDTIRAYSPYDNVKAQYYPPMLVLSGLSDPRVTYWEPTKWVYRLRSRMSGGGPILLKTNTDAGHGGAAGRLERLDDIAYEYAFMLWCTGKADAKA
jgi:oligopeptidase B